MNQIIPTIFAKDKKTFLDKLNILSKFSKCLHLDICDGKFVKTKTLNLDQMGEVLNFKKINFQVHLMVEEPLNYLDYLIKLNVFEIFVHYEIFNSFEEFEILKRKFNQRNIQVNLVVNPLTDIGEIISYLSQVNTVMLMSVEPGAEGQKFIEKTFERIRQLKLLNSSLIIQVDGGVDEGVSRELFSFGANNLCVGSYISSSKTPRANFSKLQTLAK